MIVSMGHWSSHGLFNLNDLSLNHRHRIVVYTIGHNIFSPFNRRNFRTTSSMAILVINFEMEFKVSSIFLLLLLHESSYEMRSFWRWWLHHFIFKGFLNVFYLCLKLLKAIASTNQLSRSTLARRIPKTRVFWNIGTPSSVWKLLTKVLWLD